MNYSEAILRVYNNQKEFKKLAKKASLCIKKDFGWDVFADKLIQAYKDSWKR